MSSVVKPRYGGPCISNLLPVLLGIEQGIEFPFKEDLKQAERTVLLVVDGLGASQLKPRLGDLPVLSTLRFSVIDSVLPTTTVAALTSLTTGASPLEHGLVGYRFNVGGSVLNALRWTTKDGDARRVIPPKEARLKEPFLGKDFAVVTKAEFAGTGFTAAHLEPSKFYGWAVVSSFALTVEQALKDGYGQIYCYYDGLDRVAHFVGISAHYERELKFLDFLVGEILAVLPEDVTFVLTADHGEVEPEGQRNLLPGWVKEEVEHFSGEARFRWLHLKDPRKAGKLASALSQELAGEAVVMVREEMVEEGWLGGPPAEGVLDRLGDVAILSVGAGYFLDPAEPNEASLRARHGSGTLEELQVPLLLKRPYKG